MSVPRDEGLNRPQHLRALEFNLLVFAQIYIDAPDSARQWASSRQESSAAGSIGNGYRRTPSPELISCWASPEMSRFVRAAAHALSSGRERRTQLRTSEDLPARSSSHFVPRITARESRPSSVRKRSRSTSGSRSAGSSRRGSARSPRSLEHSRFSPFSLAPPPARSRGTGEAPNETLSRRAAPH